MRGAPVLLAALLTSCARPSVTAPHGMVAASQPRAVEAGLEILKAGGSAVDAAISANACLTVAEPMGCGLGGDLFCILWDPKAGKVVGLNASGRSPLALTADKVPPEPDGTIPLFSPYAWTVPGCADGWFALHARFGRLPMARVLAPAIRLAEEGFAVTPVIAGYWKASEKVFADKPGFREVFLPGGKAPAAGEVFRNPALGKTLRLLAAKGRDAFYRGPVAEALVAFSKAQGGFLSREDFERQAVTWDLPVSTEYRGHTVWEMPPNGQGLTALEMLNILEGHDLKALGRASPEFWHLLVEAKKLAFADRARFYPDPLERYLSKAYARELAARIAPEKALLDDLPGEDPALNRKETTYLCAADADGMMVSLIQSNYTGFGSGYTLPALGFGLQNRGALFALRQDHPNALKPGRRPFHTIIPAMVTKGGRPWLAFGVMGGDMQPQGQVQVLVNLLDLGMGLQEAGDAPRFHHAGSSEPTGTRMKEGGVLHLEPGIPPEVVEALKRRGHRIQPGGYFGGYQAVRREPDGSYTGASESRTDGCARGY